MRVILDNGHGCDTKGKRSPEGFLCDEGHALYEYEFNRDVVSRIVDLIVEGKDCYNISYTLLVPEEEDISLRERVNRVNAIYAGDRSCYLVSVHANAGGGNGWEVFTSVGETMSDEIAEVFGEEATKAFPEFRMRRDIADGDFDKEAHFYVLKRTNCPAILTENFFMDTEKDLKFIMSDEGRQRIAQMHYDAIVRVFNEL